MPATPSLAPELDCICNGLRLTGKRIGLTKVQIKDT